MEGADPPRPVQTVTRRRGLLRAERRASVDDDGPFSAWGVDVLGGLGPKNDLPGSKKNSARLRAQRVDCIRAIAVVGPTGCSDPTMPASDVEGEIFGHHMWPARRFARRLEPVR